MSKFPKVEYKCKNCDGTGLKDISYHGSPIFDTCTCCNGDKSKIYFREMDTEEKLNYLLEMIEKIEKGDKNG